MSKSDISEYDKRGCSSFDKRGWRESFEQQAEKELENDDYFIEAKKENKVKLNE